MMSYENMRSSDNILLMTTSERRNEGNAVTLKLGYKNLDRCGMP